VGDYRWNIGRVRDCAYRGRSSREDISLWDDIVRNIVIESRNGPRANQNGSRFGAGSYAKPFRCYIRPRSEEAVLLVRNTECEE
jgi:hypothetical protein